MTCTKPVTRAAVLLVTAALLSQVALARPDERSREDDVRSDGRAAGRPAEVGPAPRAATPAAPAAAALPAPAAPAREARGRDTAPAANALPAPVPRAAEQRHGADRPSAAVPAAPPAPAAPAVPQPPATRWVQNHGGRWAETGPRGQPAMPARPPVVVAPAAPVPAPVPADRVADGRDWHGPQGRAWPAPGVVVRVAPPGARDIRWADTRYRVHDGSWYAPHRQGWVVVQPPFGVVVRELPVWRTVVVVGGIGYLVANGVYYRERSDGYEVVPPPGNLAPLLAAPADGSGRDDALPRQFVYPRAGQSADQQASDEYECHRWAVSQTGFDPTAGALGAGGSGSNSGNSGSDWTRRDDYLRARGACLDGRGYTVR